MFLYLLNIFQYHSPVLCVFDVGEMFSIDIQDKIVILVDYDILLQLELLPASLSCLIPQTKPEYVKEILPWSLLSSLDIQALAYLFQLHVAPVLQGQFKCHELYFEIHNYNLSSINVG